MSARKRPPRSAGANPAGVRPQDCPCGSSKDYTACCEPLHIGQRTAPTAETLMRSRYAAFALGLTDYLMTTWHPSTRPQTLTLDPTMRWTGLTIEERHGGSAFDTTGTVRFTAAHQTRGRRGTLTETSRFVVERGQWYYVDGDVG